MNEIVPRMSKTQMAMYLGKVHYMSLIKPESGVAEKVYVPEPAQSDETSYVVGPGTHEEKLDSLVKSTPAWRILWAVALGDVLINKLSQTQASKKYALAKSRIQRMLSQNPDHSKGGKQYPIRSEKTKSSRGQRRISQGEEGENGYCSSHATRRTTAVRIKCFPILHGHSLRMTFLMFIYKEVRIGIRIAEETSEQLRNEHFKLEETYNCLKIVLLQLRKCLL